MVERGFVEGSLTADLCSSFKFPISAPSLRQTLRLEALLASPRHGPHSRRSHCKQIVVGMWAQVNVTRCFSAWWKYASDMQVLQRHHAEMSRSRRTILLVSVLKGWHKRAHGRTLADQLLLDIFVTCMRHALRAWSLFTWASTSRRSWLQRNFSSWVEHAVLERRLRVVAVSIDDHTDSVFALGALERHHKLTALIRWRQGIIRRRLLKKRMYNAILCGLKQWMHSAWQRWWGTVREARVWRKVALRWVHKTARNAFSMWRIWIREEQRTLSRQHSVLQRMLLRMKQAAVAGAFDRWNAQVERFTKQRAGLERIAVRLKNICMCKAHSTWVDNAKMLCRQRGVLELTVLRMSSTLACKAFEAWLNHTGQIRQQRSVLGRMALRIKSTILFKGWATWYEEYATAKRHALQAHKLACWCLNAKYARAFARWEVQTAEQRKLRLAATKVIKRWTHQSQGWAWGKWWGKVRHSGAVKKAALRWTQKTMRAAWSTWETRVTEGKRMGAIGAKVCLRWQQRAVAEVWMTWVWHVEETRRLARETEKQVCRKRLTILLFQVVFGTWKFAACTQRLALQVSLKPLASRLSKRISMDVLHAWREALGEKRHRRALASVMRNRRVKRLTWTAVERWQGLMAENRTLRNKAILLVSHNLKREQAEALLHQQSRFLPSGCAVSVCSESHETQVRVDF